MKKVVVVVSALLVMGLVFGMVAGGLALAGKFGDEPPPVPSRVEDTVSHAADVPSLTENEIATARYILGNDSKMQSLVPGGYIIERIAPWLSSSRQAIGALIEVSISPPVNVDGEWPFVDHDGVQSSDRPYQQTSAQLEVRGLQRAYVLIDLTEEELVSIDPIQYDQIIAQEVIPPKTPTGE